MFPTKKVNTNGRMGLLPSISFPPLWVGLPKIGLWPVSSPYHLWDCGGAAIVCEKRPFVGYVGGQAGANGLWYFSDGYFDPQTGQFLATNGNPLLPLAAAAMANPAGLLFGPALFISWRRRKGKKGVHPATFLLLGVLLAAGLSGCDGGGGITGTPGIPTIPPTGTSTPMPTVTVTQVPTATSTATIVTITATPTACPTPTQPPPTDTPTPSPIPTPPNLPAAPDGWHWVFISSNVKTTQYSTEILDSGSFTGTPETPYGADDQPITEFGQLPQDFLLRVGYQGSDILPSGDFIQYAREGVPVEPGSVPFRYFITRKSECDGYPKAGNGTCAVPDKTGAVGWPERNQLVPVGSRVFIVELNLALYINDTGKGVGANQVDIYTGFENNLNYYRDGLTIWRLVADS
ncbi:MAG: hypothetical protein CSA11_02580 [Chloroflexi bacterium]|nr:MAG: hypothetical protein CSA11_02580 [Chloroflexota bacterium]